MVEVEVHHVHHVPLWALACVRSEHPTMERMRGEREETGGGSGAWTVVSQSLLIFDEARQHP